MTPFSDNNNIQIKEDDGGDDLKIPTAVGNEALPPQSTTDASKLAGHHVHFANSTAKGYPVRGEKNWQAWAGDMEDFGDMQTASANSRPPYNSTL